MSKWTKNKIDDNLSILGRGIIAICPTPNNGGVFECVDNKKRIKEVWNACINLENPESDINQIKNALEIAKSMCIDARFQHPDDEVLKEQQYQINEALALIKE